MTWYRRYKAVYSFEARSETELSMNKEDLLIVQQKPDGTWPTPEKWMEGYNEFSGGTGEFPAGAYVEFLGEFIMPNSLPPQPAVRALPVLTPRHVAPQGYNNYGESAGLYGSVDSEGVDINDERREEEDVVAPPAPPPRRSTVEEYTGGYRYQPPPQTLPRPTPRKKFSLDSKDSVGSIAIGIPTHRAGPKFQHNWICVTFRIPVQCSSCKLFSTIY